MNEVLKSYQSYASVKRYGIRCEINRPSGSYPLHRHDYFEFEIIKEGSLLHELNGVQEVLGKGDMIALSPKDLHRFTVLEPVKICNFCVYYRDASSAVENLISSVQFPLRGNFTSERLQKILEYHTQTAKTLKQGGAFEQERITAYTLLFLTELFSVAKKETPTFVTNGYQYIAGAMDFISQNYTSQITLKDVANSVCLTPSYLSKLFAQINGKSFIRYLTEQRVEHAKLLLSITDRSISDIAFASGFGSFSSFSRTFLSYCGVTPHQFRKNVQKYGSAANNK